MTVDELMTGINNLLDQRKIGRDSRVVTPNSCDPKGSCLFEFETIEVEDVDGHPSLLILG